MSDYYKPPSDSSISSTSSSPSSGVVLDAINPVPDIKVGIDAKDIKYTGHGCINWPVYFATSRNVKDDEEIWLIQEIWAKQRTWANNAQTALVDNKYEALENGGVKQVDDDESHYWEAWKIKPGTNTPDYGTIHRNQADDEYQPTAKPAKSRGTFRVEGWILAHRGPLPQHFTKGNPDTAAHHLYSTTIKPHGWDQTDAYGTRHSLMLRWNTIDADQVTNAVIFWGDKKAAHQYTENMDGSATLKGEPTCSYVQNRKFVP